MEVNANNIHDYVRRYSEHRMLKIPDKALKVNITFTTINMDVFFRCASYFSDSN